MLQVLTLIRNPLIINDHLTNGWHDINMTLSGGGNAAQQIQMKFDGNKYSNPSDAEIIAADTTIYGTAIISNDMSADMQAGAGLYLSAK